MHHKRHAALLILLALAGDLTCCWAADPVTTAAIEPGPEDGGLRLRLAISPRPGGDEGYDVRLDVLNVTDRDVALRAAWRDEHRDGNVSDYLAAATSIECIPAVAPWIGGVQQGQRISPQAEHLLKSHDSLSIQWQTPGRRLKNHVTNPNEVQNPEFPFPGLYSVHATVNIVTSERTVRLRSNEQLVSVGGSQVMPKHTYGSLLHATHESAMLGLGSLHKIEPGDEFEIGSPKGHHWKLTITDVGPETSTGRLELLTRPGFPDRQMLPPRLTPATLVRRR